MTNTIRHEWQDDLKLLRTHLSKATSRLWQGRGGQSLMRRLQKKHHIRSIEVTHGENGYHPHVHTLLFLDRELTDLDKLELGEHWHHAVEQELGARYAPDLEQYTCDDCHCVFRVTDGNTTCACGGELHPIGTRIDESHRTDYIAKLGLEVAAITSKSAKHGNRTMWQVANDAATGDKKSAGIWARYVRDMFGCRQLFWSKGAKQTFGIQRLTDEQIANDGLVDGQPIGVALVLAQWDGLSWDAQAKANPYWLTQLITATLEGAASIASLAGQCETTAGGHVPIKRPPLQLVRQHVDNGVSRLSEEALAELALKGREYDRARVLDGARQRDWVTRWVASRSQVGPGEP